jgi:hypothetical protein
MLRWLLVAVLLVCAAPAWAVNDYTIDLTWQLDTFATNESTEHWNAWTTAQGWTSLRAMFMEKEERTVAGKPVNVRSDMGLPWQVAPTTLSSGLTYDQTGQGSSQGVVYADHAVPFYRFSSDARVLAGGSLATTATPLLASHVYHAAIDIDDAAKITFTVMQNGAADPAEGYEFDLVPSFQYDASLVLIPGDATTPPQYHVVIKSYPTGGTTGTTLLDSMIEATDQTTAYIQYAIAGANAKLTYWIAAATDKAVASALPRWEFVQVVPATAAELTGNTKFVLHLRPTLTQASIFVTHSGPLGQLRGVNIKQTLTDAKFITPWATAGKTLADAWDTNDFGATPKSDAVDAKGYSVATATGTPWMFTTDTTTAGKVYSVGTKTYRTISTLPTP